MTPTEKYLKGHLESGLRVGERVKITRRAKGYEGGWVNEWISELMDRHVGCSGTIVYDEECGGFKVSIGGDVWCYPYFVLEKVNK